MKQLSLEGLNFSTTEVNIKDKVMTITLDRPEKKNAMNNVMMNEINYLLAYAKQEKDIRVVVFAANGDVFCAGADLSRTDSDSNVPKLENSDDILKIIDICSKYNCPIVPWGTGTSLEGHSLAVHGGVTVNFSKMNAILSVNTEDMDVVVQPGITRKQLNEELRHTGLMFSVDPGADASIGGMASTRASGTTAVKYGTMANNVLALKVALADGQLINTGSRARKSSSGYDLTHLFIGSEGTLGLIT